MWSILSSLSVLTAIVGVASGWWFLLAIALIGFGVAQWESRVALVEQISRD